MQKNRCLRNLLLFLLLLSPVSAWASERETIVALWMGHLVFGDFIFGLCEGLLLSRLFKTPRQRSIKCMIAANYFSSYVGSFGLFVLFDWYFDNRLDVNHLRAFYFFFVFVAYLLTIVLEYGFILRAFGGKPYRFLSALKASIVIQTISCLFLFGVVHQINSRDVMHTRAVEPSEIAVPSNLAVYFIGQTDGNVYCYHASNQQIDLVAETNSKNTYDSLAAIRTSPEQDKLDFVLLTFKKNSFTTKDYQVIRPQYFEPGSTNEEKAYGEPDSVYYDSSQNKILIVSKLCAEDEIQAEYWCEMADPGIIRYDLRKGKERCFVECNFELIRWEGITTYLNTQIFLFCWLTRNLTILPDDKLVLQLGWNQVCIFDPSTQEIALIARGYGILPVLE